MTIENTRTARRNSRSVYRLTNTSKDWRERAACINQNPELFFPTGITGTALLQLEQAKRVCESCPVREDCLRWAMELGQDYGVWGGVSEEERRSLKRRAARKRAVSRR
jgi:WhiB family redox-sensing transcriptional regulator